jgi:hypothetical protein
MIGPLRMLVMSTLAASAWAAPLDLDAGLRAAIYDDNYKLGVGGELGAVTSMTASADLGLHLNYTHFAPKTDTWTAADEFGVYAAWYFRPALDQGFSLRIGPHVGYAHIKDHYLDLGGDLMAVFGATPSTSFYATFVPSYLLIGENSQSLVRIGFGVEYHTGK